MLVERKRSAEAAATLSGGASSAARVDAGVGGPGAAPDNPDDHRKHGRALKEGPCNGTSPVSPGLHLPMDMEIVDHLAQSVGTARFTQGGRGSCDRLAWACSPRDRKAARGCLVDAASASLPPRFLERALPRMVFSAGRKEMPHAWCFCVHPACPEARSAGGTGRPGGNVSYARGVNDAVLIIFHRQ